MTIRITTATYLRSHGKSPRGQGNWAFAPSTRESAYAAEIDYDQIVWFSGSYTDARRQAIEYFTRITQGLPGVVIDWVAVLS